MSERMTAEREAEIRQLAHPGNLACHWFVRELLAELEAVRKERDAARQELSKLKSAKPLSLLPEPCEQHGEPWCDCDK